MRSKSAAFSENLKRKAYMSAGGAKIKHLLDELQLETVCNNAACPNLCECRDNSHLTVMILGSVCTRSCRFCNVTKKEPRTPDEAEPGKIAQLCKELSLEHLVATSPTRDDLPDKGAGQFYKVACAVKKLKKKVRIEFLIPDFSGERDLIFKLAGCGADVIAHNIEMPRELYRTLRPGSDYDVSLGVLKELNAFKKEFGFALKSSIMLGLGEDKEMIERSFEDLKRTGVDILYLGQYLRPSQDHCPVEKFYAPEEFEELGALARKMGFVSVMSGSFVRSSYRAKEAFEKFLSEGLLRS